MIAPYQKLMNNLR